MAAAFTLSAGVVGYWCRDPFVASMMVMLLVTAAMASTVLATGCAE